MRQSKTRWVAVYPNGTKDGRRFPITRSGGVWWWDTGCGSSHLADAKANVEAEGGRVVREPNPNYREPRPFEVLGQLLGKGGRA